MLRNYESLNSDKDGKGKQAMAQELLKGLSRWLSDWEHLILSQRTWVWFPAHVFGDSQPPVTPTSADCMRSSGLCRQLNTHGIHTEGGERNENNL